jgi:hypothetical protein
MKTTMAELPRLNSTTLVLKSERVIAFSSLTERWECFKNLASSG